MNDDASSNTLSVSSVRTAILVLLLSSGFGASLAAATVNTNGQCTECHADTAKQMPAAGKHAPLGCTTCHAGHPPENRQPYPVCTNCHKPHSDKMTAGDCGRCHRAHSPQSITYDEKLSPDLCRSCHQPVFDVLAAGNPKHRALSCTVCHRVKHKARPACTDCHGRLHPAVYLTKFPQCGQCHHTAHDLNHWPETKK